MDPAPALALPAPSALAHHFALDPSIVFLNHGSFGACPRAVLDEQQRLRERLEREPVTFFLREAEPLLDAARAKLGRFLGASADDLAFVTNATTGCNTVLRSINFEAGDELLTTNHAYNACANALRFVAERSGARLVVARVPFPADSAEEITASILAHVTPRTRLALLDHVTSPTGIIFPLERIIAQLDSRGIDTLIDGAHAPGMLPLSLDTLGAAYYTGNCHKWLCAPKGAAFLHVRRDRQSRIRPLTISHGANTDRPERSRYRLEFDWPGTIDPTPFLCIPAAIDHLASLVPGGWPEVLAHNHRLALEGRRILADSLGVPLPAPDELLGSLASVPLPDSASESARQPLQLDPLQEQLYSRYKIEVPIFNFPAAPQRYLRISAQLYNSLDHYRYLADSLRALLS